MKTIFITGASSGIGMALAREFSHEDVVLGLLARRKERLDRLANDLAADVYVYAADVDDSLTMRSAAEAFIQSAGIPDLVIANAGVSSGTLVGISSIAGFRGIPGSGAYSASKAAATAYLESLRVELSSSGVNVLTVCPGYIKTPMTDVNSFYMPFLMDADRAARSIRKAIVKKKRFHVLPWQMSLVGFFLRLMPRCIYDPLMRRAPRKPKSL